MKSVPVALPGETPNQTYQRLIRKARDQKWELAFLHQIAMEKLPQPATQLRFHPKRKWAFDFAWPDMMVAVEVDGGTRMNGRHNRHQGFTEDCRKINEATALGWRVFRFPGELVKSWEAVRFVKGVLKA